MAKKKKKFTVPEFKTWLEGIMQFQDAGWSPNGEQWNEIYSKIMDLKEPINREKMSLTDGTLDEINGIVYDQVKDALANSMMNMQPQVRPQPQQHVQQTDDVWKRLGTTEHNAHDGPKEPVQIATSDELASLSLAEIKRRAEAAQENVAGNRPAKHKLADRTDDASIPDDFA